MFDWTVPRTDALTTLLLARARNGTGDPDDKPSAGAAPDLGDQPAAPPRMTV